MTVIIWGMTVCSIILEPRDIAALRESFVLLIPVSDLAADLIILRLIETVPVERRTASIDLVATGSELMLELAKMVELTSNPEQLARRCNNWTNILERRGLGSEWIMVFKDATLYAISTALGPAFNERYRESWSLFLNRIEGIVLRKPIQ